MALETALVLGCGFGLMARFSATAAEWSWTWTTAPGDPVPTAQVSTFKYDKRWAYAIEIDDGPKWVRAFAVPFLAQYHYTDAPPGVRGGTRRPLVGSVSVIVASTGNNEASLNWEDLAALLTSGWGVMNHSYDHHANDWSGPDAKLTAAQARTDAYWSQTIFAAHLPGGRAPSGAVYANGYTAYNLDAALSRCGVGIATRVGGSSPRNVLDPKVNWMDFTRSYLDENVWRNSGDRGEPMADFPLASPAGPASNHLVIDFTHGIDRAPESPNQQRWRARLRTIEDRWGAGGDDSLWCAPTAEIHDYVQAARMAKVRVVPGQLSLSLPDSLPGSALTVRLSGLGHATGLSAPTGGALYQQGDTVVLTSPLIGQAGAPAPTPHLKCLYDGPVAPVHFSNTVAVAGVTLGVFGNFIAATSYRVSIRSVEGEKVLGERKLGPGWVVGGQLIPVIPENAPARGTEILVTSLAELKHLTVWGTE